MPSYRPPPSLPPPLASPPSRSFQVGGTSYLGPNELNVAVIPGPQKGWRWMREPPGWLDLVYGLFENSTFLCNWTKGSTCTDNSTSACLATSHTLANSAIYTAERINYTLAVIVAKDLHRSSSLLRRWLQRKEAASVRLVGPRGTCSLTAGVP